MRVVWNELLKSRITNRRDISEIFLLHCANTGERTALYGINDAGGIAEVVTVVEGRRSEDGLGDRAFRRALRIQQTSYRRLAAFHNLEQHPIEHWAQCRM